MKLIIDISEDVYTRLFDSGIQDNEIAVDDVCEITRALRLGTPLDNIKAELASKVPSDKLDDAYVSVPYVFEVLNRTGKAESEE